ncbi:sulfate adenylyltransferase [Caldinitratiruptor microaerophilus]|uniref:Sulfate adenylyltransferase n=1 Tax=Caldinitratiruptor microaerophilus TaxID=671077 RepID=A0AA35G7G2_9FIRM|nr:sulfate adenylyltransferase [Caldinitratiruptor microaerophilus]BDG60066.1 sulfate adenylyltransferase [Caldinitratiruptor microaerophilus]
MPDRSAAGLVPPHGGTLVDRVLRGDALCAARERVRHLPAVRLDPVRTADLECITTGVFSPLDGFMDRAQYDSVLEHMHLPDGLPWTLPVTLPVPVGLATTLRPGAEVALVGPEGRPLGLMQVREAFSYDPEREARRVFGTCDPAHPGVARLRRQPEVYLAGPVWLLERPPAPFPDLALDPAETRRIFAARGWRHVVGFQTRNPVHRAHEYIQKVALELVDGLFLNPLLGPTKDDDVPAALRVRCYRALLGRYYPEARVLLAAFPAAMRYAGPREAVFHAICRKNYGCSHFIVGRDHAGVGHFYGPHDSQRIFSEFDPHRLGLTPLFFDRAFWCRTCGGMASDRTCPHPEADRLILSGTRVREMLRAGVLPPPEFTRPEVARLLAEGMRTEAEALEPVAGGEEVPGGE